MLIEISKFWRWIYWLKMNVCIYWLKQRTWWSTKNINRFIILCQCEAYQTYFFYLESVSTSLNQKCSIFDKKADISTFMCMNQFYVKRKRNFRNASISSKTNLRPRQIAITAQCFLSYREIYSIQYNTFIFWEYKMDTTVMMVVEMM